MKTIKLYANYGLLGAEKRTVYSEAHGDIYDIVSVALPDGWQEVELIVGRGLESPWGEIYMIGEAIRSIDDAPWIDVRRLDTGEVYRRKLQTELIPGEE